MPYIYIAFISILYPISPIFRYISVRMAYWTLMLFCLSFFTGSRESQIHLISSPDGVS